MPSANYQNTKLLLMKLRRENEAKSPRPLSPVPAPSPQISQIMSKAPKPQTPTYQPYSSKFDRPVQREVRNQPACTDKNRPQTPNPNPKPAHPRDLSNTSTRSTRSVNFMPEYKHIGKSEKKLYVNKPDLRFDITDINNKKRKFKYSFEKEHPRDRQKLLNYLKAQNLDKYSKELPERKIREVVDYGRGIHRPEESKFMEGNPNGNSYIVHQNNSTYRKIDQMKMMLKKEAHNLMADHAVITRGGRTPDRGTGLRSTGKSANKSFR